MSETFNVAIVSPRINFFDYYVANLTCQSHINSSFFVHCKFQCSYLTVENFAHVFLYFAKKKKRKNINIILMHDPEHEKSRVEVTKAKINHLYMVNSNLIKFTLIIRNKEHY